jgi:outer membrane protein assembly factor BamD (BamD/ComL family)
MLKLIARLSSHSTPGRWITPVPASCASSFFPVQSLCQQRLNTIHSTVPVKLSLRSEDSMNLYERACLYLEFGEWNKAVTLLEAAAQRLHALPSAASGLMQLSRDMRRAEHKLRELPVH